MRIKSGYRKKGYTTAEYAVLLVTIVGALVVMQVPLRRAINDKWRSAGDAIGHGRQYESKGSLATRVYDLSPTSVEGSGEVIVEELELSVTEAPPPSTSGGQNTSVTNRRQTGRR